MSIKAPIRKSRKSEIVAVGSEEIGFIYLEKRAHVTVGEREVIDEWEIKRQQGLTVIDKLLRKVASDRGITRTEAQNLVFPQQVEGVEVVPEGENILLEYPEEAEQLSLLNLPANKLKAIVATEFIKNRVAYPVELVEPAIINDEELAIAPSPFYLKNKEGIKFNSCLVTIKGNHDLEAEKIRVDPISESISSETIGYWYSHTNKKIVIGSPDWNYKDTSDLDERLVDVIFEFYQNERSGWVVGEQKEVSQVTQEEKKIEPLELSTGKESSLESKRTKSLIPA